MSVGRLRPLDAIAARNVSSASAGQRFTVIHGGGEIDQDLAVDLLDAIRTWTIAAEPSANRCVDVWAAPWHRLVSCCVASVTTFGGPLWGVRILGADDLVARMRGRGLAVRQRRARQSVVDDAELQAISQGWPVRYI